MGGEAVGFVRVDEVLGRALAERGQLLVEEEADGQLTLDRGGRGVEGVEVVEEVGEEGVGEKGGRGGGGGGRWVGRGVGAGEVGEEEEGGEALRGAEDGGEGEEGGGRGGAGGERRGFERVLLFVFLGVGMGASGVVVGLVEEVEGGEGGLVADGAVEGRVEGLTEEVEGARGGQQMEERVQLGGWEKVRHEGRECEGIEEVD